MDDVDDIKRALRVEMRRVRTAIADRDARVGAIWDEVVDHCRRLGAQTVMAFVGVGTEPDTSSLLELLAAEGIAVVLPRVEHGHIVAAPLQDAPMAAGRYGIPSPDGPAVDAATIDVVVVPGLAFTRDGRRLGQGGGYYDRFLPLVRNDCTTIGVCFAEQLVDDLATEPHDRILDLVVTDGVPQ